MKEKIASLISILERMESLYLRVYSLLQVEREALIQLDYEKIYQVLVEKDEITSVLRSLDAERLRLQDQVSIMFELSHSDLNLRDIAVRIEKDLPALSSRLLELRSKVNKNISILVDRITVNRSLIEKSVKNLQDIAKNFSRALSGVEESNPTAKQHGTYDGKAKYSGPKQGSGSLVRKQL
jgi:predicted transcriptional regulator